MHTDSSQEGQMSQSSEVDSEQVERESEISVGSTEQEMFGILRRMELMGKNEVVSKKILYSSFPACNSG